MEKKPPANEPVEKTNKCTLDSGKKSKKNGYDNNDWPKPEFRSFECRTILQQFMCVLTVWGFCKNGVKLVPILFKKSRDPVFKKVNSTP